MAAGSDMLIVNVHTPTTSFALPHSFAQDTLESLFHKLTRKIHAGSKGDIVGPGWLKYEWNDNVWNLDDESDYTILAWRLKSVASETEPSCTLYLRNVDEPLPVPPAYVNPSYYVYRTPATPIGSPKQPGSRAHSVRSGKSRRSGMSEPKDEVPQYKKDFMKFHTENGVRTVEGSIGPVSGVRMLLKKGYRHVYISRAFAMKHNFIPKDAAPGLYGYGGLVNIGQWPVTVGKTKTVHSVYLSEETHFECILGRSFMERRQVKTDPLDPTNIICMDTGEKIDCELVIIRDGKGEFVTVT